MTAIAGPHVIGANLLAPMAEPLNRESTGYAANLQTATYKMGVIFAALDNDLITHLALHFWDWSWGTAPTYRISLQGVDASGNPDGTIKAAGAAYADFTPAGTGNDGKMVFFALGTPYQATRGELLAIVLAYQSGTVNSSNHTRVTYRMSGQNNFFTFPYSAYGDGAWTRSLYQNCPWAYQTATATRGNPVNTYESATVNTTSSPNEYGAAFQFPATFAAAIDLAGAVLSLTAPPAGKSFTMKLYAANKSTVLIEQSFDADQMQAAQLNNRLPYFFTTADPIILYPDTEYTLALVPDQADTALVWHHIIETEAATLDAFPFGSTWYSRTRTNGGAWTDRYNYRPVFQLIAAAIYPTYPPPDPDAIDAFPIVMFSAADAKTPLEGLTVTAETMIDGADFTACTNAVTEKSAGVYLLNIAGADQGQHSTLLKFTATGALTQYASLVR